MRKIKLKILSTSVSENEENAAKSYMFLIIIFNKVL